MKCKICQNQNIKLFNNINLVKCKNCSILFTYPEPEKNITKKFYAEKDYFKHWFQYKDIKFKTDSIRLNNILKLGFNNCKLLDYGCGPGFFLKTAKNKGFDCYGIEYSEFAVDYCKKQKLNVTNDVSIPLKWENNYFDVITMWHVLEHLNNPVETLNDIFRILKPNGILIIEIPNLYGILSLIRGKKKLPVIEHLFHYTNKSLTFLLNEKFKILKMTPGNPGYTRKGIKIFIKKNLANLGKFLYQLSGYNFGDTIYCIAKPKK